MYRIGKPLAPGAVVGRLVTPGAAPPAAPARNPLPCAHEGAPAPPPNGVATTKTYLHCGAGLGVGGVVCRCNCNSGCGKYEADG